MFSMMYWFPSVKEEGHIYSMEDWSWTTLIYVNRFYTRHTVGN